MYKLTTEVCTIHTAASKFHCNVLSVHHYSYTITDVCMWLVLLISNSNAIVSSLA